MTDDVADTTADGGARLAAVLAFLLGCLPFALVVRLPPNPGFWGQWVAVVIVLVWLALRPLPLRALPWGSMPLFGIAALLLVQSAAGLVAMPLAVVVAACLLGMAGLMVAAGRAVATSAARSAVVGAFAWGVIAGFALNTVAVVLGWVGYEFQLYRLFTAPTPVRAYGLIGQANHLGVLAVFATFAAFHLRSSGRMPRVMLWCIAVAAAVVCAATVSRVAIGVAAIAALLALAWLRPADARDAAAQHAGRGELALLALLFALVQVGWALRGAGAGAAEHGPGLVRSSFGRVEMLKDAFALWAGHPVLGVGQGNYAARRLHDLDGPAPTPATDNAHNLVAHALAEWGLVGAAVAIGAAAWALLLVWRHLRDPQRDRDELFASIWVVGVLAHSMVEHPLWFAHFLFPFALMLGMLRQPGVAPLPEAPPPRLAARLASAAVVLGIALAAAWDYSRSQAIALGMLLDLDRAPGTPPRVQFADAARVEAFTLFPLHAKIMLSRKLPLGDAAIDAKLKLARQAMDAIPNGETVARYAAFAVVAGRADEARTLLERYARRSPNYYARSYELLQAWKQTDPRVAAMVATLPQPAAAGAVAPPAGG
jgi:hypothetical protein